MRKLVILDGSVLLRLWDPEHPRHHATVTGVTDLRDAHTKLLVPTTALIDVLVGAERDGPRRVRLILRQIHDAFGTPQPIDFTTTKLAAHLRAQHEIRTPDALVIAAAHMIRATQIITTNEELTGVDPRVCLVAPG